MNNQRCMVAAIICAALLWAGCGDGTVEHTGTAGGSDAALDASVGDDERDAGGMPDVSTTDVRAPDVAHDTGGTDAEPDAEPDAPPNFEPEIPEEPLEQVQFMWPIDAWVAANHNYYMRGVHSGSADFAAPHGTPVFAARGGTVTTARWTELGGNTLIIDHGGGYSTVYSHLIEPAYVAVGDTVEGGELVGALGRTGNAFLNGAHLHFAIRRDGTRLVIPGLDYGDWVQRGDKIPGTYGSLSTFQAVRPTYTMEVLDDGVPAFTRPEQGATLVAELAAGTLLPVIRSDRGYYEVTLDSGQRVWVVHNALTPEGVRVSGVRITANNANIRTGPSTSSSLLGTIPNGRLVTVFETRDNFHRLLYGLPTVYGWTHVSNTEPTAQHDARIRAWSANVRSSPEVGDNVIGSLQFTDPIVVLEQRHGWYRFRFNGADAWVAGWLTQGRL